MLLLPLVDCCTLWWNRVFVLATCVGVLIRWYDELMEGWGIIEGESQLVMSEGLQYTLWESVWRKEHTVQEERERERQRAWEREREHGARLLKSMPSPHTKIGAYKGTRRVRLHQLLHDWSVHMLCTVLQSATAKKGYFGDGLALNFCSQPTNTR